VAVDRTHYDTLGLTPQAGAEEIRAAYRHLARRYHPDKGSVDARAMAALNEAYRVLREPARRAAYDASLRAAVARPAPVPRPGTPRPEAPPPWPRPDTGPARYPWKLVLGMFMVGVVVVLVMAALYKPAPPPPADGLLVPGSCVLVEVNGDAREVVCGTAGERVVAALVPTGDTCPAGSEPHRDAQGRGTACLEPEPGPTTGP
jgi:plasmid stabilization system protein ParE